MAHIYFIQRRIRMSEEEKKAIEIIKGLYIEEYDWYEDSKYCTGHSGKAVTIVENSLKTILNLIDNQQKEIEKLNFENHMIKKWNEQLDTNCISKDKIREKIKEIESYAFTSEEEKNQQDYAIKRINEMLEEN